MREMTLSIAFFNLATRGKENGSKEEASARFDVLLTFEELEDGGKTALENNAVLVVEMLVLQTDENQKQNDLLLSDFEELYSPSR